MVVDVLIPVLSLYIYTLPNGLDGGLGLREYADAMKGEGLIGDSLRTTRQKNKKERGEGISCGAPIRIDNVEFFLWVASKRSIVDWPTPDCPTPDYG